MDCEHDIGLTITVHKLLAQLPILAVCEAHAIQYKKCMIRDTHNIATKYTTYNAGLK